jgi:transcriptional regulator with XRE-family HTH domain/tetratricopeptide (TPR) repeat protein
LALTLLRRVRGWEQEQLAAASGVGLRSIEAYEQGLRTPSAKARASLLEALDVSPWTLSEVLSLIRRVREEGRQSQPDVGVHLGFAAGGCADELRSRLQSLWHATPRLQSVGESAASFAGSRQAAPALWARLCRCSVEGQRKVVQEAAEFQTAGFCELLCEESRKAARDSAERARHLADLAVLTAERMAGDSLWRSRLSGYARMHLANALRAGGGDLQPAERMFLEGEELFASGSSADPAGLLNEARVLHLLASLRRAQRRLGAALELLERALALDRWGERPSLLISKAKATEQLGRYEEAIAVLQEAESAIDGEREPVLRFLVRLSLSANLCHLRRYAEAAAILNDLPTALPGASGRLDQMRAAWQRGKIEAGLGRNEEAIATLDQVRNDFAEQGNAYDAALVTVEVAEIYAALGRTAEVRAMVQRSAPIFEAQGVHQEARRALALFCRAVEAEKLNAKLLRGVIAYLYRARRNPQLAFELAPLG